ncbi:HNH/ENDO VII family nuclease [Mycobacteroides abscessus]|uniref:HNH/ENDO VII family nuclease n=1 Tax=Mycobacteroides abscessus TaxID=36809 RepID=UPI0020C562CD|nr:HNH/ENDO VII family nuclease [Mycobacteroides abscessus]
MTPLDEFMAKKANDYMAVVDTWRPEARQFKEVFDEYKRWVGAPNGTEWTGRTSNAAYDTASTDCHSSDNTNDTAEDGGKLVAATIQYEVVEPLVNGQRLIERVLEHKDQGVSIDQQYHVDYHPAAGESDESIARNREHVADIERQVKGYVAQWEKGCQTLKTQADATAQTITGCINPKTALVDGRKILRDATAPKPGDPTAQPVNFYKDWYPKATDPASTQAAAATAADPNAPVLGPPSPGDKPPVDPRTGSLTGNLGVMGINEPKSPLDKPPPPPDARTVPATKLDPNTPQGKAAIDKFRSMLATQYPPDQVEAKLADAIKGAQQDRPMVATPEPGTPERVRQSGGEAFAESWDQAGRAKDDLLGINGGDHAKEAWTGVAKGLWDVVNPDPAHQVERGIDQAKGAIDEVKSGIDNPKAFIGKHGIEIAAGIATAPVGGEGALLGTEGRALTHGLEDSAPGHHPPQVEHHTPTPIDHTPTTPDIDGPRLDADGNPLKYLNGRPDFGPTQEPDVWNLSRDEQVTQIESGLSGLEMPGPNQQWVQLHPNGPIGEDWTVQDGHRLIEWQPGDPRKGLWDMGHTEGNEYYKLRDQYHDGSIPFRDFIDEYRDPENYRVQDPYRNRSHIDEAP